MNEYLTTEQIAKILNIKNVITVRRWINKGLIDAIKIGKEYRISNADFEKFIVKHKVSKKGK